MKKIEELKDAEAPMKMDDDFGNMPMMRYHDGIVRAAPLNYEEKMEVVVPALGELAEKARSGQVLSDGEQLAYYINKAQARKLVKPARRQFDEWTVVRD